MTRFPFHLQISGLAQGEQARKVHVDVEVLMIFPDFGPIMVDSQVLRQFQRRNSTDFLVGTIFFSTRTFVASTGGFGSGLSSFVPSRRCAAWVVGCLGGDFCLQLETISVHWNPEEKWPIDPCVPWRRNDVVSLFVFFLTDLRLEEFHAFFLIIFVV